MSEFAYVAVQDGFYIRKVPITDDNRNSFKWSVGLVGTNIFSSVEDATEYLHELANDKISYYKSKVVEWELKNEKSINVVED